MTQIINTHKTHLPGFGFGIDQAPVCILTVLCVGATGKDCAAYRGVTPDHSMDADRSRVEEDAAYRIASGGHKLSYDEASKIFSELEEGNEGGFYYRR